MIAGFVAGYVLVRLVFAYRVLGGCKLSLLVALASPWLLTGSYVCLEIADESLLDCWNHSDPVAFVLGVCLVPLGLVVAALAQRPPDSDLSAGGNAKGRPAAAASPSSRPRSL